MKTVFNNGNEFFIRCFLILIISIIFKEGIKAQFTKSAQLKTTEVSATEEVIHNVIGWAVNKDVM